MNVTSRSDVGLMTVSPRGDAPRALVGKVAVPKTGQKPPSPHGDATGVPVGWVAVPKTGQNTLFDTPGCLWSTCGLGHRADGFAAHPLRTSTGRIMLRPD
ncbi:MAG: hypothetical protein KIG67_04690 [Bacteroidales bacterium]|nr:hypothetical protein [Bacteroidales bacterium]